MESERRYEKNSEAQVASLVAWLGHNIFTSIKSANVSSFVQSVWNCFIGEPSGKESFGCLIYIKCIYAEIEKLSL